MYHQNLWMLSILNWIRFDNFAMQYLARNGQLLFSKNISTAQYNFDQLVMTLNKSIQLEKKIQTSSMSPIANCKRLTTAPQNERKYDSSYKNDSRIHGTCRSQCYDNPLRYNQGYQRDLSRPDNRFQIYKSRSSSWFQNNSRNFLTAHAHQVVFALEIDA